VNQNNFEALALEIFHFQYNNNPVYYQFCQSLNIDESSVNEIKKIPFLPISFFKTHRINTTTFEPQAVFESSGTTSSINSRHFVKDITIYEKSFTKTFELFYGNVQDWCIIALLPSYLERKGSSLVMMAQKLIEQSSNPLSGFYLNDYEKLNNTLLQLEEKKQKTLLIGVTFALLDFAEQFPIALKNTILMETGGTKGRRKEITRPLVHEILCKAFNTINIHSEYGMTELLSQAYSKGKGIFQCPPWMKILIREEDDPFAIHLAGSRENNSGAINIIDLANIYSCAFIAVEDAGKLYPDASFEVSGRIDHTDIRGCSLMTA
jgi:hypothetical protein